MKVTVNIVLAHLKMRGKTGKAEERNQKTL